MRPQPTPGSAYEWRIIKLTCKEHPGVTWNKPLAWTEPPPCFICDPVWWAEHAPPPADSATSPEPPVLAAELMARG